MDKKEKQYYPGKSNIPDTIHESDPISLKDNPAGETVCSPHFSLGCINEDTDLSALNEEDIEHE